METYDILASSSSCRHRLAHVIFCPKCFGHSSEGVDVFDVKHVADSYFLNDSSEPSCGCTLKFIHTLLKNTGYVANKVLTV